MVERTSGHLCLRTGRRNLGGVTTWEDEGRLLSNLPRGAKDQQQSTPMFVRFAELRRTARVSVELCSS